SSHSVYNPSQEPPVCFGLYIRQDAAQSYCEVLLYSIDAIYELQECSVLPVFSRDCAGLEIPLAVL
ncbi:MAG: hypothetical protein II885_01220, partial [Oscillospiraceae bacterium]|nr:hypothetical protein [Oscillospiraceae bacterium]